MRRVYRGTLPLATRRELFRRRQSCGDVPTARTEWRRFRSTNQANEVVTELRRMAGARDRCYYCSDSRAVDIEHYWPVALRYDLTFSWDNLLWACTACNRKKGDRFPLGAGQPILLNPARDDPWRHFILDSSTGILSPRYLAPSTDPRAEKTVEILDTINHESATEGRRRSIVRLTRMVENVRQHGDCRDTREPLVQNVKGDDYRISQWYALWEGRREDPFHAFRSQFPSLWSRFERLASGQA